MGQYSYKKILFKPAKHLALAAGLTNLPHETSDIVHLLCSSIINYETVYKPTLMKNYMQADKNGEDHKIFFTNCQY